jgi:hypothetical protein
MDRRPGFTRRYGFVLVTLAFFLLSWAGQFITQLMVVIEDAAQHGQAFEWGEFWAEFWQSTFENWQSEFLQLIWQALGLKLLLCWGSSQSREGDSRIEAKVDALCVKAGMNPDQIGADANAKS